MKQLMNLKTQISLLAAFVCTFVSGCLQVEQTINLKPDGSGTIVISTVMSKEAMDQIKAMGGEGGKNPLDEMMSEEKAKEQAEKMGEGVKFVKAEKVKTDKGEGAKITFSFADISKVKMDVNLGDAAPQKGDAKPPVSFQFTKGSPAKLTMTMNHPPQDKKAADAPEDPNEAAGFAMAQQMMKGMRITMNLNVDGTLVATNATHKDGNKITLMDVPMDELLKDPKKFKESQKAGSFTDAMSVFKDVPGLKVESKPTVTVELK
jgi:hypothetical protein